MSFGLLDTPQDIFVLSCHNYNSCLGYVFFLFPTHLLYDWFSPLSQEYWKVWKSIWKCLLPGFQWPSPYCYLESVVSYILHWEGGQNGLILCWGGGVNKRKNAAQGKNSFYARQHRTCRNDWKCLVGIWSLLVLTLNAMMPTDSLYCCQLNGIMSVWKVFENELKIIFTSGWLLLPHVNRTLSEWPRFWDCINCSFNLDWRLLLFWKRKKPFAGLNCCIYWFPISSSMISPLIVLIFLKKKSL